MTSPPKSLALPAIPQDAVRDHNGYQAGAESRRPGGGTLTSAAKFELAHQHRWGGGGAGVIEVDSYGKPSVMTPELANEALTPATKMLLLVDPNNPLGSGYTHSQVKGLAEIAQDHDLWLVDDVTDRDFQPAHVLPTGFAPERTL